jgi:DnaK suppressor protein
MALRKEKIEGFKKDLSERRETLAQELRRATAEFIRDDVAYTDAVDQASADVDKAFAMQMKNRERDTLWKIDEALKRIEDGNYGTCERCDDEIAEARMRAFPFTTLCIDCKAEIESEEQRFPGRVS